jgi:hypothetical protein
MQNREQQKLEKQLPSFITSGMRRTRLFVQADIKTRRNAKGPLFSELAQLSLTKQRST